MVRQLNSERVVLDSGIEVQPILSWAIQHEANILAAAFDAAEGNQAEYEALQALGAYFLMEALPSWDFADHRGVVPVSLRGWLRLPLDVQLASYGDWRDSLNAQPERAPMPFDVIESDARTAVDAVVPPGPLNRELKRRLKAA